MHTIRDSLFCLAIVSICTALAGCDNSTSRQSKQRPAAANYGVVKAGSSEAKADTVCFLNTRGLIHKDNTQITLIINKGDVSGRLNYMPYHEPALQGTLTGSKQNDLITAVWALRQQNKPDTIKIQFRFTGNKLYQHAWAATNGKLTADSTGSWSVAYRKINCGAN